MRVIGSVVLVLVLVGSVAAEVPVSLASPYLQAQVALAGDSTEGVSTVAHAIVEVATMLGTDAEGVVTAG